MKVFKVKDKEIAVISATLPSVDDILEALDTPNAIPRHNKGWWLRDRGSFTDTACAISNANNLSTTGKGVAHQLLLVPALVTEPIYGDGSNHIGEEIMIPERHGDEIKETPYILISDTMLLRKESIGLSSFRFCMYDKETDAYYDGVTNQVIPDHELNEFYISTARSNINHWYHKTFELDRSYEIMDRFGEMSVEHYLVQRYNADGTETLYRFFHNPSLDKGENALCEETSLKSWVKFKQEHIGISRNTERSFLDTIQKCFNKAEEKNIGENVGENIGEDVGDGR